MIKTKVILSIASDIKKKIFEEISLLKNIMMTNSNKHNRKY